MDTVPTTAPAPVTLGEALKYWFILGFTTHARFSWGKLAATTLAFIAIWLAAVYAISGQHTLADMGSFFAKAAFLTIGGAYAVLPYVYRGGVKHFMKVIGGCALIGMAYRFIV